MTIPPSDQIFQDISEVNRVGGAVTLSMLSTPSDDGSAQLIAQQTVLQASMGVRVDKAPNGQHRLVTMKPVMKGGVLFVHPLTELSTVPTRTSIQVGEDLHTESGDTLCYMDHSFSPTVRLEVVGTGLHIIALVDMYPGTPITFDYNLTEAKMACPFTDYATGCLVEGWDALNPGLKLVYRQHFEPAPYLKD